MTRLKAVFVFLFLLLSAAQQADAACVDGTVTSCVLNGKQGTRTCEGGKFSPCEVPQPPPPPPPVCPQVLSVPATAFECQCRATDPTRCAETLPMDTCNMMINEAFGLGLITTDAQSWLANNQWCPVHYDVGNGDRIQALCKAGCFAEDTEILTGFASDGTECATQASQVTDFDQLLTLADEANLDNVTLVSRPIGTPIHGPERPALFVFDLANGARLRVTQHHPMVLDTGAIVEASQVSAGSSFVAIDGTPVAVISISREQTTGDVYNFTTASDTQLGHIIVAEGVLVGDLKLQAELAAEEHSIELRH
jgi:hypothetical protein